MLDVLQALNAALGRSVEIVKPESAAESESDSAVRDRPVESPSPATSDMSVEEVVVATIAAGDRGEGVDYDAIVRECSVHGHSREEAEDAIDSLRADGGQISEHRFGWFRLIQSDSS
jgi:hypothetical protein